MASTCAPILIKMGLPAVCAHFFVFYFGIVADITPPVALAAYAGSAIAKSNPMKTGVNATKLAIAAFIVPYIFAYSPALLFENLSGWWQVLQIAATSIIGIFGVAGCIAGCITATGLASKLITGIVAVSRNSMFIALFLTMLCCIVLGMGVPTTAN